MPATFDKVVGDGAEHGGGHEEQRADEEHAAEQHAAEQRGIRAQGTGSFGAGLLGAREPTMAMGNTMGMKRLSSITSR